MSRRFLFAVAAGFLLIFALGVAAVIGINNISQPESRPAVAATPSPAAEVSAPAPAPQAVPAPAVVVKPAPASQTPSAQFAGGSSPVTVQPSDIDQLAAAVKLGGSESVGKDVWARETPIAKKLLKGMCDCDQRNWLNHFVETGDEAISGSQHYYESVQLLATLRRGNQDLASQTAH